MLPGPKPSSPFHIPLVIKFDCAGCKKRVTVMVADLVPISKE